ncbi:MAG TPA: transporter [Candidatus Polarisedimenticolia bacterium]|nr:transporter [Candidatus Polarisedimenticolia bacterium]
MTGRAARAVHILAAAGVSIGVSVGMTPAAVQTFAGMTPAVSTATFQDDAQVDLASIPLTLGFRTDRFSLRAVVPYLDWRATTPAMRIGGPILGFDIPAQDYQEQGLGDIFLTPSFQLLRGGMHRPSIWANLRLKAPTGDPDKHLGTGEFDYAPGFGMLEPFGTRFMALLSARYVVRGDPPNVDFANILAVTIGGTVRVATLDGVTVSLSRGDVTSQNGDPIDSAALSWYHPIHNGLAFTATALGNIDGDFQSRGIAIGVAFNDSPWDWGQ